MADTTTVDHALELASKGWHVHPVGQDKRPILKGWPSQATNNLAQVEEWWRKYPKALVAVVPALSGHTVVDIDVHDDRPSGFSEALREGAPIEAQVQGKSLSGNGRHLWYRGMGRTVTNVNGIESVDVRGVGGYVVVPYALPGASQVTEPLPTIYRARDTSSAPPRRAEGSEVQSWLERNDGPLDPTLADYAQGGPIPFRGRDVLFKRLRFVVLAGEEGTSGAAKAVEIMRRRWEAAPHNESEAEAEREFQNALSAHIADAADHDWPVSVEIVGEDEEGAETAEETTVADPLEKVRAEFPLLDLAEILDPDRPPRKWLWDGIVPEGDHVSIVASAGTGKSLLVLSMVVALLRRESEFAGRALVAPERVLYVDMENSEDDWHERLSDLGVTVEEAAGWAGRFLPLSFPRLAGLDTEEGARQLVALIEAYGITENDVIVLDSTQRITSGEENSNDTMRRFYALTSSELKRRKITTIRTDNTGHEAGRARGASAKRDDVSMAWILAKVDGTSDCFTLSPTKRRSAGSSEDLTIQRVTGPDEILRFLQTDGPKFSDLLAEARRALDDAGVTHSTGLNAAEKAVQALPDYAQRQADGLTRKLIRRVQSDRKMAAEAVIL